MKILIVGCDGRMGRQMSEFLQKRGVEIVGIDVQNREVKEPVDVILDFSSPVCLEDNLQLAKRLNVAIVIGTTGHTERNLQAVMECANSIPIFLSSNFSLLFNFMLQIVGKLNQLADCDFVVTEIHHKNKKDVPSGSCKEILSRLNDKNVEVVCHRVGKVIGKHSVQVFAENEMLEICHEVENRDVFCEGAFLACKFVLKKHSGLFQMSDLLQTL